MDSRAEQLTLFRWSRPDPRGNLPQWVDGEPLLGEHELEVQPFPLLRDETRWMAWDELLSARITYSPLDDAPELWRRFVDLREGEESYLSFASRYGVLSTAIPVETQDDGIVFNGVPYSRWLIAHRTLRTVWLVYEAVKAHRTDLLSKWILIDEKKARFVGCPVPGHKISWGAVLASPAFRPLSDHWDRHVAGVKSKRESLERLAMLWIWRIVNLCMRGPQAGAEDSLAGDPVTAMLDVDFETHAHAVRFNPSTLLAAMWLQFAKAIEGNLEYRQCAFALCRGWFVLSPVGAGKRRHSLFCSDRCRLREWRREKEKRHAKTRKG
jgi:hypothetical protein